MDTPLSASATPVGTLFSSSRFVVPQFQRDYAWELDEVREFWTDLRSGLEEGSYFLGLVILTDEGKRKHIVDGQQRLLTVTLLASALYHEALRVKRQALAERLRSDFLEAIDYETDEVEPRLRLSDSVDNKTLESLVATKQGVGEQEPTALDEYSQRLVAASREIREQLRSDLASDPFKRLGLWSDYLTNRVHLAVFVHPDSASAYRVFEVVNTRGRELTTADLLKSYILSQTPQNLRDGRYKEWMSIARPLAQSGTNSLVQFIRHVVTLNAGHVLPRDLFAFLADRPVGTRYRRRPPSSEELMAALKKQLPLYLQMLDPTLEGPAEPEWLGVFAAFQDLNVITVRPFLMAISGVGSPTEGMRQVLALVVRRMVVGNLGTGNVERRLSEAAFEVTSSRSWEAALNSLTDLNPEPTEFVEQLRKRSFNKGTLTFLRRSLSQTSLTPNRQGFLHFIRPRQAAGWREFPEDDVSYWGSTVGNTMLASEERRPKGATTWRGFKQNLLPFAESRQDREELGDLEQWGTEEVEARGAAVAREAAAVWYPSTGAE